MAADWTEPDWPEAGDGRTAMLSKASRRRSEVLALLTMTPRNEFVVADIAQQWENHADRGSSSSGPVTSSDDSSDRMQNLWRVSTVR